MEKTLFNQVGEVKGASSENEDSFSFQFTPQNENLKKTRGALFTLITIEGPTEDRYDLAKKTYHQLQSSYYARTSGSILHSLGDTLDQFEKETFGKEENQKLKFAVLAAVFWGSVLYLGKIGSGAVFVSRADKVKRLEFSKVASGVLEDQDTICLASDKFIETVSQETLQEALAQTNFEKALESLDQALEKVPGAVCDVIRLSVNQPEAKPQALAIAEVDEKGEAVEVETPEEISMPESDKTLEEEIAAEETTAEELPRDNDPFETPVAKKENVFQSTLAKAKIRAGTLFVTLSKPWRRDSGMDPISRRKAQIIQVISVIAIVLVVSLLFGFFNNKTEKETNEVASLVSSAQADLSEAANIKTIDPTRALALVDSANQDLKKADEIEPENTEVDALLKQSEDLEAEITKTTNLSKLDTVFDFNKLKEGTKLADIAQNGSQMLLVDRDKATVFSLNLDTKQGLEVSGTTTSPQTIASYPAGYYLTNNDGIVKLDVSYKPSNVGNNSNWGKIVSSSTYQNNLYLLDTGKGEIWRYLATSTGLGAAKAYISGERPDIASAVAIAIDDYVWVANKSGVIYKLAQGKKQDFGISGLADPLGEVSDFYTSTQTKNNYILDSGKARVVVIDKNGVYQAAFANNLLHDADLLIADEAQKIVYVATSDKLYSFKLP